MAIVSIYNSTHGAYTLFTSRCMRLIQVGVAVNHYDYGVILKDNTGENISLKNPYYCELTAQYWAWKNDKKSDYIGFMHYRRNLNFSGVSYPVDIWGCINHAEINEEYEKKFGLHDNSISQVVCANDLLLPEKWNVRNAGSKNNFDHYARGEYLRVKDYEAAIDLLKEKYPEYAQYADDFNKSCVGWYTNIFVMSRPIFENYSKWLFGFLGELEKKITIQGYNQQEKRVIGHIAERLFNIYIEHLIDNNKSLKCRELQRTFVQHVPKRVVFSKSGDEFLPFVICFDDNYAHAAGALIQSIIDNSSLSNNYELYLICDAVTRSNKQKLLSLIGRAGNFRIRFVDSSALFDSAEMHTSEHFAPATYARLFIPSIFPDYGRVVFIDSDMIVKEDVAKLHKIDLQGKKIGAVKDLVMEGFVKFGHMAPKEFKGYTAGRYLSEYLGMSNPDNYFQAGLLVMDIPKIKADLTCEQMVRAIYEKKYWYHDQDILNKVFEGEVCYLDMSWNVYHGNGTTERFFPNLRFDSYMSFLNARENLKIVHFAGDQKPWINSSVDYAELYYGSVFKTPWAALYIQHMPEDFATSEMSEIKRHVKYFLNTNASLRLVADKELSQALVESIQPVMSIEIPDHLLKNKITQLLKEIHSSKKSNNRGQNIKQTITNIVINKVKPAAVRLAPMGSKRYQLLRKIYRSLI